MEEPRQMSTDRMKKLHELRMRRNEARKLNHQDVAEEDLRSKLPANWEAKQRRVQWEIEDSEKRQEAESRGDDYDQVKLLGIQADFVEKSEQMKRKKKNPDVGFSTYDAMTLRQYNRLTRQIKPDVEQYREMKNMLGEEFYPTVNTLIQDAHYPSEKAIDRLVQDVHQQIEKRSKFRRSRVFDPDAPIDFINNRNRRYNEKLERFYGKYTEEIKQNLERGTAV
uniref:Pre-mRNA-splicing factor SYF2 n=1 Tax=Trichuris muris TaxID=70415 RepID=A0A5S6QW12_TRIMR